MPLADGIRRPAARISAVLNVSGSLPAGIFTVRLSELPGLPAPEPPLLCTVSILDDAEDVVERGRIMEGKGRLFGAPEQPFSAEAAGITAGSIASSTRGHARISVSVPEKPFSGLLSPGESLPCGPLEISLVSIIPGGPSLASILVTDRLALPPTSARLEDGEAAALSAGGHTIRVCVSIEGPGTRAAVYAWYEAPGR